MAYQKLTELAPDFLKDFNTRSGLAINRYWREAVGHAGDPRSDRKTIPMVGPLYTAESAKRLLSVLDYGLRDRGELPDCIFWIAPQVRLLPDMRQFNRARR
jgi:hypothetical protein